MDRFPDLMRIIAALNVAFDIRITTGTLSLRISTALRRCSRSCVSIGKKHDAVRANGLRRRAPRRTRSPMMRRTNA